MKAHLLRPSYFLWLVIPVLIYASYQRHGNPYFIWSYEWLDQGQGYDPLAYRHYTRCTYLSFKGEGYTVRPQNGKCGWVVFRKDVVSS